ncbi:MAG: phosphoketolase family protein [bacterium]
MPTHPLTPQELVLLDMHWRAANYLSIGQIYLLDNPLLRQPLTFEHVKPRLLGHWGTTPGLNFLYTHLNRVIKRENQDMIFVAGPGHGGPGLVACTYLEGTYTEFYPNITQDTEGLQRLFKQFSFPGGIPSHAAPETPGSIHEGGELGYALSHAYGIAFDNPDLIVAAVVGDGEAETGPLATSWHSNKFVNPATDGVVLPILHLNGYKIANPTILSRIPQLELEALMEGYGHEVFWVEGEDPLAMHHLLAETLDTITERIKQIKENAKNGSTERPRWPMIVLKTPKGWTGPALTTTGKVLTDHWRSHQVPLANVKTDPAELGMLETWMKSYRPEELFTEDGNVSFDVGQVIPEGDKRMGSTPHANGGLLLKDLRLPDFRDYAVPVEKPGTTNGEATRVLGSFLRDIMKENEEARNFRLFGPDETASNRLDNVYEITGKQWHGSLRDSDTNLVSDGRVMEILSEHTCEGWLEGYLLSGRHGMLSCYEAFIHIIDSMVNQHAKWMKTTNHIAWRRPVASLTYLLTSHVWRQDHNGFSHQDPGFLSHLANKKADVVRLYLPPDTNTLLSVADHCLRSRQYVNVIVAGKQPALQFMDMESAVAHCTVGLGSWDWASNDDGIEPDVVMACAGDVPTLEALAAVDLIRQHIPELKVRFVNVVDLMALQPHSEHPHGLADEQFDSLFTLDKPVIFAFHGYPLLIHQLTYRRASHFNIHVRGYKEEGTTTTPFDMVVMNDLDRFKLVMDVIDRVPGLGVKAAHVRQAMEEKRLAHKEYVRTYGDDMPEIKDWVWPY